jgi:hypothetical protein
MPTLDHTIEAVHALHPPYREKMAHLVLAGWVFQGYALNSPGIPVWRAYCTELNAIGEPYQPCISHSLMTLLDMLPDPREL